MSTIRLLIMNLNNKQLIIILFTYWKNILNNYKEFKHITIFSSINANLYITFKNYIRNYLSNYTGGETSRYLDNFFINTLYRYQYEKDALILQNIVSLPNVNNSIHKLCIRRLNSNIYKWYLYSLSPINNYTLVKIMLDDSIKYSNIDTLSCLRILSIASKKHSDIIIDLINNYVETIVERIATISLIENDIYVEYITHLLSFYIFRGSKNKALKIYLLYKNKNIPSRIRKLCEYSMRYKYGRYLVCNHGIIY